jgi:hypothetical protein
MHNPTVLACKRCGVPLPAARIKAPTTGWYCTPCYRLVFITATSLASDLLTTGAAYLEVVQ